MKLYVGCKIIKAKPMNESEFRTSRGRSTITPDRPGYLVRYADGYLSWSPEVVFEESYRELTNHEKRMLLDAMPSGPGVEIADFL